MLALWLLSTACFQDNNAKPSVPSAFSRLVKSYEPPAYKGKVPQPYYTDRGAFDYWRYPLVYPYAIHCVDTNDYGSVCSEKGKVNYDEGGNYQLLTAYFDKFTFDAHHLVARRCKTPFDSDTADVANHYFIFSFADGKSKDVRGLDSLRQELKHLGFRGDTALMTIRQYEDRL
ncbi:hypothetical protein EJV47_22195 [Hymenobacter gummosus]|uniref:Uncharacterized protein n=1 Tax=Hymenobacter gummosus TaxID=1776032 RepID=A0A3S0H379_9BACT|nr:hypothetical protein [Hymenobacter gummosus]RTQ46243.1 hypothetical protein EJV47_22195 [Hymenobacter gummosus]